MWQKAAELQDEVGDVRRHCNAPVETACEDANRIELTQYRIRKRSYVLMMNVRGLILEC